MLFCDIAAAPVFGAKRQCRAGYKTVVRNEQRNRLKRRKSSVEQSRQRPPAGVLKSGYHSLDFHRVLCAGKKRTCNKLLQILFRYNRPNSTRGENCTLVGFGPFQSR